MSSRNDRDAEHATPQRLDGNAAAGVLRELFAVEMTTAIGTCAHCGNVGELGEAMLYGGEIGMVLRCSTCEGVLMVITHTPEGYWLDLQGIRVMRVAAPS